MPPAEWPTTRRGAPRLAGFAPDTLAAWRSARPDRVTIGPIPRPAASNQSGSQTGATTTAAAPRSRSRLRIGP